MNKKKTENKQKIMELEEIVRNWENLKIKTKKFFFISRRQRKQTTQSHLQKKLLNITSNGASHTCQLLLISSCFLMEINLILNELVVLVLFFHRCVLVCYLHSSPPSCCFENLSFFIFFTISWISSSIFQVFCVFIPVIYLIFFIFL